MKYLILTLIVVVSALSGWGLAYRRNCDRVANAWAIEHVEAKRIATLITSADSAGIRGETQKQGEDVIIRDTKWIHCVGDAVASTVVSGKTGCLCSGWRTAYFYRNGQRVISVAAIHGCQLRIYWQSGGGDYPVDEANWNTVAAALEIPTEANHSTKPASPSRAGSS